MAQIKKTRTALVSALLTCLTIFGSQGRASASPTFPPVLRDALEKQLNQSFCVPLCTACHLTTAGGPGNYNLFGAGLFASGLMTPDNNLVAPAVAKYLGTPPPAGAKLNAQGQVDTDGDGIGDIEELKNGDSPSVPGPRGVGQFCTDLKYGCAGGRIAPAPPPADNLGLLSAAIVVVGFAAMRRRQRKAKRAT
jgi:hypothetical protein